MSGLPKGWATSTVGELFASHGGGTPDRSNPAYWNGGIPWLSSGDIKSAIISSATETITPLAIEKSSARMCRPGSILVVVRSGILKHTLPVSILATDAAINQDIKCFDCGDNDLNKWLAITWRASSQELLSENREGTTVQSVKSETLKDFPLPVPPLAEQRRIVAKFEALLGKIGECRKRFDKIPLLLKRFRQSVLAAACSGRLTAAWRGDHDTPDWTRERAEDVCAKVQSGGTPRGGFSISGVPFLKVYNIQEQKIDFEFRPQYVEPTIHLSELKKSIVRPGDVVMNIVGPPLGKVAIIPESFPEWNINQAITLFRPSDRITTGWLYSVLSSGINVDAVDNKTRGSAGQQNISLSQCRDFEFPVPLISEQHEIVCRVEALFAVADQVEAQYGKAKGYVDRLTQSILAKAFRGELVPQDENDEPASVLLDRIRAQRTSVVAAAPPTRKPRGGVVAPATRGPSRLPPAGDARQKRHRQRLPLSGQRAMRSNSPLSRTALAILKRMKPERDYARADLADALGLSVAEWNSGINELKDARFAMQTGERRGARYRKTVERGQAHNA